MVCNFQIYCPCPFILLYYCFCPCPCSFLWPGPCYCLCPCYCTCPCNVPVLAPVMSLCLRDILSWSYELTHSVHRYSVEQFLPSARRWKEKSKLESVCRFNEPPQRRHGLIWRGRPVVEREERKRKYPLFGDCGLIVFFARRPVSILFAKPHGFCHLYSPLCEETFMWTYKTPKPRCGTIVNKQIVCRSICSFLFFYSTFFLSFLFFFWSFSSTFFLYSIFLQTFIYSFFTFCVFYSFNSCTHALYILFFFEGGYESCNFFNTFFIFLCVLFSNFSHVCILFLSGNTFTLSFWK